MKTQHFSKASYTKKLFVLHSTYTGNTTYRVWFDLNNSLTRWKRPIFKIRYLRNSKISVWNVYDKTNFFSRQAIAELFLFYTLPAKGILHTQFSSIWTTSCSNQNEQYLKFVFRKIRKIPYENPTFFLGKLYQKVFLFYTLTTQGILLTEFGLIWTTPWPDEKPYF